MKRKPVKRKPVKRRKPTDARLALVGTRLLYDRLNETNERLRVIEGDIERLQNYVGVLANKQSVPLVPISSPDWKPVLSNRTSSIPDLGIVKWREEKL